MPNITFDQFDKFERKQFAERLTTVISTFYPFADDAYVLSLNAKFGSGKTTFLQMWKNHLETAEQGFKTIFINAWEEDFNDEPLIPIVHALLKEFEGDGTTDKAQTALKGALGATALVGNSVLAKTTGINVKTIMEDVENDLMREDILSLGEDLYAQHHFKRKAYESLRAQLKEYIETLSKKPLVIFVDELDRVRPDYAVKFLEAVKHIFPIQGVCFVLGVDRKQMECSIRQLYGDIDFENYYRRFITREAELPEVRQCNLTPFLNHLADEFLNQKREAGLRFPFKESDQPQVLDDIKILCRATKFAPREIETFFRIFSQFMALPTTDERNGHELYIKATLFMITVFIHKRDVYHKIGEENLSPDDLHRYIKSFDFIRFNNGRSDEHQLVHDVMCAYLREDEGGQQHEQIADIMLHYHPDPRRNIDIKQQKDDLILSMSGRVDRFRSLSSTSIFETIYKKIENWNSFLE